MSTEYVACVCTDDRHDPVDYWGDLDDRPRLARKDRELASRTWPSAHVVIVTTSVLP